MISGELVYRPFSVKPSESGVFFTTKRNVWFIINGDIVYVTHASVYLTGKRNAEL